MISNIRSMAIAILRVSIKIRSLRASFPKLFCSAVVGISKEFWQLHHSIETRVVGMPNQPFFLFFVELIEITQTNAPLYSRLASDSGQVGLHNVIARKHTHSRLFLNYYYYFYFILFFFCVNPIRLCVGLNGRTTWLTTQCVMRRGKKKLLAFEI